MNTRDWDFPSVNPDYFVAARQVAYTNQAASMVNEASQRAPASVDCASRCTQDTAFCLNLPGNNNYGVCKAYADQCLRTCQNKQA